MGTMCQRHIPGYRFYCEVFIGVRGPLTLLVRGLSMRGLPFSLVWAHLHAATQGLSEHAVLSLDSMVDTHFGRVY